MRWLVIVGTVTAGVWFAQAWYRRWMNDLPDPALEIKPPTYRYHDADETLEQGTRRRREAAAAIRRRASRVETGETIYDVFRKSGGQR